MKSLAHLERKTCDFIQERGAGMSFIQEKGKFEDIICAPWLPAEPVPLQSCSAEVSEDYVLTVSITLKVLPSPDLD